MDIALNPALSPAPDLDAPIPKLFQMVKAIGARLFSQPDQAAAAHRQWIDDFLDILNLLEERAQKANQECGERQLPPDELQKKLLLGFVLRYICDRLPALAKFSDMDERQREKLKRRISALGEYLSAIDEAAAHSGRASAQPPRKLVEINGVTLTMPLRLIIENDADGKHVSCLELPQLYGFGDTEREAIEMLEREILSLRDDVKNSPNVSDEYRYAADLIDLALLNEK